ncbi:hypothetical protein PoB_002264100 [Plakobranchus ocellatus]|uniref:Uncharacterized protein n=1 Tax=Plakobranchus ocellatus TaxID=259542 RepID=A0AAV3ZJJ9_9GAST|nr:hypothetical protein PoB_002264100 [Plakobranchus ocellatus]
MDGPDATHPWGQQTHRASVRPGAGGGTRTCNRRVPVDLRADSLSTVSPAPRVRVEDREKVGGEEKERSQ